MPLLLSRRPSRTGGCGHGRCARERGRVWTWCLIRGRPRIAQRIGTAPKCWPLAASRGQVGRCHLGKARRSRHVKAETMVPENVQNRPLHQEARERRSSTMMVPLKLDPYCNRAMNKDSVARRTPRAAERHSWRPGWQRPSGSLAGRSSRRAIRTHCKSSTRHSRHWRGGPLRATTRDSTIRDT